MRYQASSKSTPGITVTLQQADSMPRFYLSEFTGNNDASGACRHKSGKIFRPSGNQRPTRGK
jgi:hypothetical protein